jgi:hypothetical protein
MTTFYPFRPTAGNLKPLASTSESEENVELIAETLLQGRHGSSRAQARIGPATSSIVSFMSQAFTRKVTSSLRGLIVVPFLVLMLRSPVEVDRQGTVSA